MGYNNDETGSMLLKTHTHTNKREKQSLLGRREKVKSKALTDRNENEARAYTSCWSRMHPST